MSDTSVNRAHRWAVAGVVAVIIVASAVAVVPLGLTLVGGVLLVAWVQGQWDPTWNDGDGWFGFIAAVLLVLVLTATAASAGALAYVGRLPARRIAAVSVPATLLGAFTPILLLWIIPRL